MNHSPSLGQNCHLPVFDSEDYLPARLRWHAAAGAVLVIGFSLLVVFAAIFEVPVVVPASGVIRPLGELKVVEASVEGKVDVIYKRGNDKVREGDPILVVDDGQLRSQIEQIDSDIRRSQNQLRRINSELVFLQSEMETERTKGERASAAAEANLKRLEVEKAAELEKIAAQLESARSNRKLAEDVLSTHQDLFRKGLVSKLELQEKKSRVVAADSEIRRLRSIHNIQGGEISIAVERLEEQRAKAIIAIAKLNKEENRLDAAKSEHQTILASHQAKKLRIEKQLEEVVVRAPVTGTIQALSLRNVGQIVTRGQKLATIVPSDASIQIRAEVDGADVGNLAVAQTAMMRVSACPYSQYGVLKGEVRSIAADAGNAGIVDEEYLTNQLSNTVFGIDIEPEKDSLAHFMEQCGLQFGMRGKVDIVTDNQTILQFLQRKLTL